ncbi:hypothetical protein BC349_06705 [Flavihumibacter stibioxidans]|uniref:Phage protein n=1 Tax=Flavihumibacter stibioxidans TaxID=1834163 RepID=A0ABR7M6P3_9BACT|nr:hypothetical protein [Flavihumibacter stibioxidans]
MKKFCCDTFRFRYEGAKEMGLNFRIIKLSQPFIERSKYKGNIYRYLITEGYQVLDSNIKIIFIEYCPHCGRELRKLYNSDLYVNELDHEF